MHIAAFALELIVNVKVLFDEVPRITGVRLFAVEYVWESVLFKATLLRILVEPAVMVSAGPVLLIQKPVNEAAVIFLPANAVVESVT